MKRSIRLLLAFFLVLAIFGGACSSDSSPTAPAFTVEDPGAGQSQVGAGLCPDDLGEGIEIPRCAETEDD